MRYRVLNRCLVLCFLFLVSTVTVTALSKESLLHEKPSDAPEHIEVKPTTSDEKINQRLKNILNATHWFTDPEVKVTNGVVFLSGATKSTEFKEWAGNLALNTQDVAAVVNKIEVLEPSIWSFQLILQELILQGRKIIRAIPALIFGLIILSIAWVLARLAYKVILLFFVGKTTSSLLHEVIARALCSFIFLLGIYFIFEIAELTRMAITVISGTGLIGIIIGIAFRDITENFLASILLSMQSPFQEGDLIDIICSATGYAATGYVERLTFRVTILMTQEGNHLQIPNATVYKSNIRNYTSNPNRRDDFTIILSSKASISKAQHAAIKVIDAHEAVLKNPEPLVLVENLTTETVTLRIYYWIDSRKYSWLKVRSALIRLIKKSLQSEKVEPGRVSEKESGYQKTEAESKLSSQTQEIKALSVDSTPPEKGENLLQQDKKKKDKGQKEEKSSPL